MLNKRGLRTYTKKERNMYMTGLAGQNILYNVIGATFAYYLQFTLLIPAITVGTILAIARVFDAINDPIMGTIVDRTNTKWGKMRPYLLISPILILFATMACFSNGFFDDTLKTMEGKNILIILWAFFAYVLWDVAFTMGDIPIWGVTALMTEDEQDRNKLLSYARIAAAIGGGVALLSIQPVSLALGTMFYETGKFATAAEGERMGFIVGAFIYTFIGCLLFQLAGVFVRERVAQPKQEEKMPLLQGFKIAFKNKPFMQVMISGILGSPKHLVMLAAMPLVSYYYADKSGLKAFLYLAILGGAIFIGQFLAMGLIPTLLKKTSKKNLYNGANLIGVIPFVMVFVVYKLAPIGALVEPLYVAIFFLLFLIGGASIGVTSVIQSQMIADSIDYEEYHNGVRPDGVFFSGQSFVTKLNSGFATILSGIIYELFLVSSSLIAEINEFAAAGGIARDVPEYVPYMTALFFLVSIPPAIGSILTVIPTWNYALDDDEHRKIIGELNKRRRADELADGVDISE